MALIGNVSNLLGKAAEVKVNSGSSGAGKASGNTSTGSTGAAGNAPRANDTSVTSRAGADAARSYAVGLSMVNSSKRTTPTSATSTTVTINTKTGVRTTTTVDTGSKTTTTIKTSGNKVTYYETETWEEKDGKRVTISSSGVAKDEEGGYSAFTKEYDETGKAVSITKSKEGSTKAEKFSISYNQDGKEERTKVGDVEVTPTEVKAEENSLSFRTGDVEHLVQTNASGAVSRDAVKIYDENGKVMSETGIALHAGSTPDKPVYANFDFEWDENNTGVLTKYIQGSEAEPETFVLERDEQGVEISRAKYEEEVLEDGTKVATLSYYTNIGAPKNEQDVFKIVENGDEVSYEFQMSLRDLGNGKIESIITGADGVEKHRVTNPDGNEVYDDYTLLADGTKVQTEGYPVAGYEPQAVAGECTGNGDGDGNIESTPTDDGTDNGNVVQTIMKTDDRIATDENGNKYVNVQSWSRSGNGNDCLSRIINNSYDLEAMGIKLYSPEYNALEKAVMDANPSIYGTEEGGWKQTVGGSCRNSAVIHPGDKIVLPDSFDGTPIQKIVTTPSKPSVGSPAPAKGNTNPPSEPEKKPSPTLTPEQMAELLDPTPVTYISRNREELELTWAYEAALAANNRDNSKAHATEGTYEHIKWSDNARISCDAVNNAKWALANFYGCNFTEVESYYNSKGGVTGRKYTTNDYLQYVRNLTNTDSYVY